MCKVDALQAHRSQFADAPTSCSLISPKGAIKLAELRGMECDARYAELRYPIWEAV